MKYELVRCKSKPDRYCYLTEDESQLCDSAVQAAKDDLWARDVVELTLKLAYSRWLERGL